MEMIRSTHEGKIIEKPRNGSGSMKLSQIMTAEELEGCTTLFARVTLHPDSEIGYHVHTGETEAYYVLSGQGIFIDGTGQEVPVTDGTICTIREGQGHGMRNTGSSDMDIIAIVIRK